MKKEERLKEYKAKPAFSKPWSPKLLPQGLGENPERDGKTSRLR
jgi:hypothetical protein